MLDRRVCFIEVECNDNGNRQLKRLEGLAIKGKVSRKMGSTLSEASVSVANLARSDIEYLTTFTSPYIKPKVKKKINIYAGYEKKGWGRIFSGDIENALPSDMPDTWLNIKAKSLFYQNRVPLSYGLTNTTTKDTAESIANNLGLAFDWQATSTKTIDVFNFTGSYAELIKKFNKLDDVTMYEDNGVIKVVDKIQKRPDKTAKLVSKDTGMIGIPEPDEYGIKIKFLIDASVFLGDWIQTKSVKLPSTDGYYQIYALDFDFASREQQYYCNASCKRYGVL